jgi:hypothetical protein
MIVGRDLWRWCTLIGVEFKIRTDFSVVLRGYDRPVVDQIIKQAQAAIAGGDQSQRESARQLMSARIPVVLRGYNRIEVDETLAVLSAQLTGDAA